LAQLLGPHILVAVEVDRTLAPSEAVAAAAAQELLLGLVALG